MLHSLSFRLFRGIRKVDIQTFYAIMKEIRSVTGLARFLQLAAVDFLLKRSFYF
jgi:hypothetical protein